MKASQALLVASSLLVPISSASAITRRAGPTSLGSPTFGSPACGHFDADVLASDCNAAVSALFSAHCSGGVCNIPASPNAAESAISQISGSCEVFVGAFINGGAATFNQGPVQAAFGPFISTCDQAGATVGSTGNSFLDSTSSPQVRLVFGTSTPGGGG